MEEVKTKVLEAPERQITLRGPPVLRLDFLRFPIVSSTELSEVGDECHNQIPNVFEFDVRGSRLKGKVKNRVVEKKKEKREEEEKERVKVMVKVKVKVKVRVKVKVKVRVRLQALIRYDLCLV